MINPINLVVTTQATHVLVRESPIVRKKKRAWKPYKSKKHRFVKRRKFKEKSGRCFIYGKKGHYTKQCKSKKQIPTKLLQLIEDPKFDDDYYTWSNNPKLALLAIILAISRV